jgi:hypothetical protein
VSQGQRPKCSACDLLKHGSKTKTSDVAFANLELGSDYDVLFRWFVGLGIEHMVCDATTFTKNHDRLFEGEWRASSWPGCCLRRAHGLDLKGVKLWCRVSIKRPSKPSASCG